MEKRDCKQDIKQTKKRIAKWPIIVTLGVLCICIGLVILWIVPKENVDENTDTIVTENVEDDVRETVSDAQTELAETDNNTIGSTDAADKNETMVYLLKNKNSVELGTPERVLNPEEIYANLTYTTQMLYGHYCMLGQQEAVTAWAQEMDYMEYNGNRMTTIPYSWQAGPESMGYIISHAKERDWVNVTFATDKGGLVNVQCEYKVQGNKVILNPANWSYDKENGILSYSMTDIFWEYDFAIKGMELTLSSGGKCTIMNTGYSWYPDDEKRFATDAYIFCESESIDGIDEVIFSWSDESTSIYFSEEDDQDVMRECVGALEESGLFTFTIPWEDGNKTYQFVYFYGGFDGIVLTDGDVTYYYNSDAYAGKYGAERLEDNLVIEDLDKLKKMKEDDVEAVIGKRENLLEALAEAYRTEGMNVTVDEKTGEISLDSAILFGVEEYELSAEGKEFLEQFISIYTSVVFNDAYKDFVSKIMIEGHTDTSGSYEMNMELSQKRAESVRNYCIEVLPVEEADLGAEFQAIGYSFNMPVLDEAGNVDMKTSRRVAFRFVIDLSSI